MSSKDLQRVTECVSDIGQATSRRSLPARRHYITQKVRIAGQRSLYISMHNDEYPTEVFLQKNVGPLIKRCLVDQTQQIQEHVSEQNHKESE